ncbi:MAG: CoA-binding protein [Deltaproteobacteria bacterium]|nr:CoA-binding protein [Deltaproteobacteria bacterium]
MKKNMYSVKEVMESKSLAVIGASHDPGKPGTQLLKMIKNSNFKGKVAGINPRGGEVLGFPLYGKPADVPFDIDLAAVIIPPRAIPGALVECAAKGVKGVVITSEGFAEAGPEGRGFQEEVGRILKSSGMRGFGPNTMGIVNTASGLCTAYFANERMLKPGSVGFAAQSGIFVGALLRFLTSYRSLRVSKAMGLGNKVDVDESDALAYLGEDDQTRVVGMYLEDIKDGKRFLHTARRAVKQKPVLLLKGGRSDAGARATASHTASMAVNDAVLGGALRQAGVLRMSGIDELMATITGFQCMPLPRGNRIALVTYSGAQAIMSIDAAAEHGVVPARFSEETRETIGGVIATPSKVLNPVDFYPDMMAHGFEKTTVEIFRGLLNDDGVDGIIFISFAMSDGEMYRPIVELLDKKRPKPVFFALLGAKEHVDSCATYMDENRLPVVLFPEMAVRVFSHMHAYARTVGKA